jgi:hypothetical protein
MEPRDLELDDLTPTMLWSALDDETRTLAALAVYEDRSQRAEADFAVASAIRFREVAVRKLPIRTRANHLCKTVRPDESLAATLLLALHLVHRQPLLDAFLGHLEVPHESGVIDSNYDLPSFSEEQLTGAVKTLFERFDHGQVEVYLSCLLAMDPEAWSELSGLIKRHR